MSSDRIIKKIDLHTGTFPSAPAETGEKGLVGAISADHVVVNPFSSTTAPVAAQVTNDSAPKKK